MTDTQVLSASSDPPLHQVSPALLNQWATWKVALLTAGIWMKLFTNNLIVSFSTTLVDLTEASAPGYTPYHATVLNGPALDSDGNAYMVTDSAFFACTGGGSDICYGAYLVESTGAAATGTATGAGGSYETATVVGGGSGYLVAPRVTATGATGVGAVLTATITDGVVTAVNIIDPGTGYTTYLYTIEPPLQLVAAGNFTSPLPLQQSTDAIPCVIELDRLAA